MIERGLLRREAMSNKNLIIEYLDAVFNQKDVGRAEGFWAGDMIQHNPQMPNGLDVLRGFISSADSALSYQPGLAMEDRDKVMVHGRYSGLNGKTMIAVDIFRIENGKVVEHWDVLQEEVAASDAPNGNPMFPAG
jgi:predicted SnoaL-like aldol condensation-catalyzing enzyme